MSRQSREVRLDAERHWPDLADFCRGYFLEDGIEIYGSDNAALQAAIAEHSTEQLQTILKQWRTWNDKIGWSDAKNVDFVQLGFGVNRVFKSGQEARQFMNTIYDAMIVAVRQRTNGNWKP